MEKLGAGKNVLNGLKVAGKFGIEALLYKSDSNAVDIYNKLQDYSDKLGIKVNYRNGFNSTANPYNNSIKLSKIDGKNPATLSHEIGHIWDFNKSNTGNLRNDKPTIDDSDLVSSIDSLSNENTASSKALAKLKQLGTSDKNLEKYRSSLENCYNNYWNRAMKNIKENLNDRLG